jgi:hypothetical protein
MDPRGQAARCGAFVPYLEHEQRPTESVLPGSESNGEHRMRQRKQDHGRNGDGDSTLLGDEDRSHGDGEERTERE